jgi:hypothetical protein
MKFLLLLIILFPFSLSAQERLKAVDTLSVRELKKEFAQITFEEQTYDFGEFSQAKEPVHKHTFEFTNTGTKNLYVLQAVSGCGCTTPKYTKNPVKPGEKGKIVVRFDAKGQRLGAFRKSITVYTNDPRSYTRLFIKGNILP